MDRASRALSVETVDGDNRGLKIGRVNSCLLFFEVFDCWIPSTPKSFASDLAPYLQFAKTGRWQRHDAAQLGVTVSMATFIMVVSVLSSKVYQS